MLESQGKTSPQDPIPQAAETGPGAESVGAARVVAELQTPIARFYAPTGQVVAAEHVNTHCSGSPQRVRGGLSFSMSVGEDGGEETTTGPRRRSNFPSTAPCRQYQVTHSLTLIPPPVQPPALAHVAWAPPEQALNTREGTFPHIDHSRSCRILIPQHRRHSTS